MNKVRLYVTQGHFIPKAAAKVRIFNRTRMLAYNNTSAFMKL